MRAQFFSLSGITTEKKEEKLNSRLGREYLDTCRDFGQSPVTIRHYGSILKKNKNGWQTKFKIFDVQKNDFLGSSQIPSLSDTVTIQLKKHEKLDKMKVSGFLTLP